MAAPRATRATAGKDTVTRLMMTFCSLAPSAAMKAMASSDEGMALSPSQTRMRTLSSTL